MKKIVLFDIDYTLFDTDVFKKSELKKHSIYNEVEEVLKKVSEIADLGIFSQGVLDFQNNKLKKTDIRKYFKEGYIHIVEEKEPNLLEVLSKYKNHELFLVDDKLTVLYKAKMLMPSVFTVWIKRGIYAECQKPIKNFVPDAIITNLMELLSIIV